MLSSKEIHIVYVGTITSKVHGSHYDLREIFLEISRNKMHIHIYPVRDEAYIKLSKENPYIHYHQKAAFYDGLNKEHLKMAFPNKILDKVKHYFAADIFALPSLYEGFGVVLIEAMTTKLPIVTSNAGAIPEVVVNNETGIRVPAKSKEKVG